MKQKFSFFLLLFVIPLSLAVGYAVFGSGSYVFLSVFTAVVSCVAFFVYFEQQKSDISVLVLIAVLTALSVAGRLIFAPVPGFKPVTAVVITAAVYFGPSAGFMVGALTALISNFYFGQGPWTPLQMFAWGIIGLIAGVLSKPLIKNRVLMLLYGVFSGVLFSLIMDIWTTLFAEKGFNITRYLAYFITSLPFTAVYAVSNVVFLLLFIPLVGKRMSRIKRKYGI